MHLIFSRAAHRNVRGKALSFGFGLTAKFFFGSLSCKFGRTASSFLFSVFARSFCCQSLFCELLGCLAQSLYFQAKTCFLFCSLLCFLFCLNARRRLGPQSQFF